MNLFHNQIPRRPAQFAVSTKKKGIQETLLGIASLLKKMDQAHQCEFVMGIVEQKEIRRPPAVSHVGWK